MILRKITKNWGVLGGATPNLAENKFGVCAPPLPIDPSLIVTYPYRLNLAIHVLNCIYIVFRYELLKSYTYL